MPMISRASNPASWRGKASSTAAKTSMMTQPSITSAARRPACAVAPRMLESPGKAMLRPTCTPAAPDSRIAVNSVVPWTHSHAMNSGRRPTELNSHAIAPSIAML